MTPLTHSFTLQLSAPLDPDTAFDAVLEELSEALGDPDTLDDIEWYEDSCDFWVDTTDPDSVIVLAREVLGRHGLTGTWRAEVVAHD